jgi:hypothetical protein
MLESNQNPGLRGKACSGMIILALQNCKGMRLTRLDIARRVEGEQVTYNRLKAGQAVICRQIRSVDAVMLMSIHV